MSPTGAVSRAPNYDIWVANQILLHRIASNTLAYELNSIPHSETRLRDEGVIPFYSFVRKVTGILESSAHERGVTIPAIPDTPKDWSEDVATDYKALAAQLRPHLVEPAKVVLDWSCGLRVRDPEPHWASVVAINSVTLDLYIGAAPAMGGMMEGSEWGPFIAQMASDELKWIAEVIGEETLRVRAQPGSGWNEEEAKRLVKEQLENMKGLLALGT